MSSQERGEHDHTGLAVILVFLVIFWVLRALFSAADQSK